MSKICDVCTVHALGDLFDETPPSTPEEVEQELLDAGYDLQELDKCAKCFAKTARLILERVGRERGYIE